MTTRSVRPEVPAPTGPAWEMFSRCRPEIAPEAIALRWHKAEEISTSGLAGAPDHYGTRTVRSQNGLDVYTVSIHSRHPRTYACNCPDWAGRNPFGGWCKHALACYLACVAAYLRCQEEKAAEAALAELLKTDRHGIIHLITAISQKDGKAARTAVARLAGWPARTPKRKEAAA